MSLHKVIAVEMSVDKVSDKQRTCSRVDIEQVNGAVMGTLDWAISTHRARTNDNDFHQLR